MNTTTQERIDLINLELAAREKALGLLDMIIAAVQTRDGKAPDKRLDTALKAIDENLRFFMRYNSFVIELIIRDRSIVTASGHSEYINDSTVYIVHASVKSGYNDGACQNGTINAAVLIDAIEKFREATKISIEKTRGELANIEEVLAAFSAARLALSQLENSTSYLTREYFGLTK